MFSIITGTIVLGFIHALIPNHWLPLVAIAKTEKWDKPRVMIVACITASAHVLGTIILGVTLGLVSSKLAHNYENYVHVLTPVFLILFGLIYISVNMPHRHRSANVDVQAYNKSKTRWVLLFVVLMFFSPCIEVQSLFLAAGSYGLDNILFLAMVYAFTSISCIVTLVMLVLKGVHLISSHVIEQYEKRITGMVLIIVGIITFYIH